MINNFINGNLDYQRDLYLAVFEPVFFGKFLESEAFKNILPKDINFFRYIDGILIIYSNKYNIEIITNKLINIEPTIKFTYELGKDSSLPILDILLIKKKTIN